VSGLPGQPGSGGATRAVVGEHSETIPAGTTSNATLDFDGDVVADVNDLCPAVPGGPTDLADNGCPGSASPLPQNTSGPAIIGQALQGQVLTEVRGAWTNAATAYQYRWLRCDTSGSNCVSVGAPNLSYTLTAADVGSTIRVSEVASNGVGSSDPSLSRPTATIRSAIPVNVAAPGIGGEAVEGQTLSAQRGTWSNAPTGFEDQWLRCDSSGASCQPIPGETGLTHQLTASDVRATLRVREAAGNQFGSGTPITSAATGSVVDAPLSLQTFALVGTVRSIIPGPIASFVDPADPGTPASAYSATIAWGDGRSSHGTAVANKGGGYVVAATHAYAKAGNYTITVRVNAAAGATAAATNRVSVFAAAVCPKGSVRKGHNCLGDIALPAGCVFRGDKVRVSLPPTPNIAGVRYVIDHKHKPVRGQGPRFRAALPTAGLPSGTHSLSAQITFTSGKPRTLSKTRTFAVC
jgi:hypothetical protein